MLLKTLGTLQLPGSSLTRPTPLLLLAYLALEGAKPRSYIAELFFLHTRDKRDSLNQTLKHLRQDAPGAYSSDDANKNLSCNLTCDAVDFLKALDQQDYQTAVHLYEGPFIADYDAATDVELEEWILGTREYLAARMREALLALAEGAAQKGESALAAKYAEQAFTLTGAPELEPDHYQRLYTLFAAVNHPRASDLRKEAEDYAITLQEPAKFQVQSPPSEKVIPNNLPASKTSFIGRDQDLIDIAGVLSKPECRLLTLHGMGGIGKSRLALQVASEQLSQRRFTDGIFFISLDALSSADQIPISIAEVLGIALQGQDDPLSQITSFIGDKQMLLILDNYEHLMDGALIPSQLLEASPNLNIIVTSREVLNLEEEWVKALDGLDYPQTPSIPFERAQHYEAVRLFVQRAKRIRLNFTLTQGDLVHVLKICTLVGGSPLALELAATWIRVMTVADIANELETSMGILESSSRNLLGKHRSIQRVFEYSWQLLGDVEKSVFAKLALFPSRFKREAVAAVTGATLPVLTSLANKALIQSSGDGWFSVHPLLGQFAMSELLKNPDEKRQAEDDYVFFICAFLDRWLLTKEPFAEISQSILNILGAAKIAQLNSQKEELVEILYQLSVEGSYFTLRGFDTVSLKLLGDAARTAAEIHDAEKACHLLTKLGDELREVQGDCEQAIDVYSHAYECAKDCNNTDRQAVLLSLIATTKFQLNANDSTVDDLLTEAKGLAMSSKNDLTLAHVLQHQGFIAGSRQHWDSARSHFMESVVVARRMEHNSSADPFEIAYNLFFALLNLGEVDFIQGDLTASQARREEALTIAQSVNNEIWIAHACRELGVVLSSKNEMRKAREKFDVAKELYEKNNQFTHLKALDTVLSDLNKHSDVSLNQVLN